MPARSSAPAEAAADFHTYTFNLARGNREYKEKPGHHAALIDHLKSYVSFSRPWVVSTQESCRLHMEILVRELVRIGVRDYTWNHTGSVIYPRPPGMNTNACSRWNEPPDPRLGNPEGHWGNYGNGIVSIGGHLESLYEFLRPHDGRENRNIVCLLMQNFGFRHLACSTHITNPGRAGPAVTRDQAINAHAVRVLHEAARNARPIVGGDFNLWCEEPPIVPC
jgi:hypothetical protein